MQIRQLSLDDLDLLIKLRIDFMLEEHIEFSNEELASIKQKCEEFFISSLEANRFIAFAAQDGDKVLSTAFLTIHERPPRRGNTSFLIGTVYNVLTYREHRRKGLAKRVLTELLSEAKSMGVSSIDLLATQEGEKLYANMGFRKINYAPMKIDFQQ